MKAPARTRPAHRHRDRIVRPVRREGRTSRPDAATAVTAANGQGNRSSFPVRADATSRGVTFEPNTAVCRLDCREGANACTRYRARSAESAARSPVDVGENGSETTLRDGRKFRTLDARYEFCERDGRQGGFVAKLNSLMAKTTDARIGLMLVWELDKRRFNVQCRANRMIVVRREWSCGR